MKHVAYEDGSHRCYLTDNGITRRLIGCRHETPRQAIAHTVPIYVHPTRSEGRSPYPLERRIARVDGRSSEAPVRTSLRSGASTISGDSPRPRPT